MNQQTSAYDRSEEQMKLVQKLASSSYLQLKFTEMTARTHVLKPIQRIVELKMNEQTNKKTNQFSIQNEPFRVYSCCLLVFFVVLCLCVCVCHIASERTSKRVSKQVSKFQMSMCVCVLCCNTPKNDAKSAPRLHTNGLCYCLSHCCSNMLGDKLCDDDLVGQKARVG